jgi:hypothetical protein
MRPIAQRLVDNRRAGTDGHLLEYINCGSQDIATTTFADKGWER